MFSTDEPLWVYANVLYPLDQPVSGAGYYYGDYTTEQFNLSSRMAVVTPDELKAAGVKATLQPSRMIETFAGDWEKEWFTYKPEEWARNTHKLYDPQWAAPADAKLAVGVRSEKPNTLVMGIDEYATEIRLLGREEWQEITLAPADFRSLGGNSLPNWEDIHELRLCDAERLKPARGDATESRIIGKDWQGPTPEFRNLRWVTDFDDK